MSQGFWNVAQSVEAACGRTISKRPRKLQAQLAKMVLHMSHKCLGKGTWCHLQHTFFGRFEPSKTLQMYNPVNPTNNVSNLGVSNPGLRFCKCHTYNPSKPYKLFQLWVGITFGIWISTYLTGFRGFICCMEVPYKTYTFRGWFFC